MKKMILLAMTLLATSSAWAYTEISTYTCLMGNSVVIRSSLMPDGKRAETLTLNGRDELPTVNCESLAKTLEKKRLVDVKSCYSRSNVSFTLSSNKGYGMLYVIKNGQLHFDTCPASKRVQ